MGKFPIQSIHAQSSIQLRAHGAVVLRGDARHCSATGHVDESHRDWLHRVCNGLKALVLEDGLDGVGALGAQAV